MTFYMYTIGVSVMYGTWLSALKISCVVSVFKCEKWYLCEHLRVYNTALHCTVYTIIFTLPYTRGDYLKQLCDTGYM